MKIAFLVWRFPVLSEPFILNQITGLIDRGHDVDIYACAVDRCGWEEIEKSHPNVAKYRLLEQTIYAPQRPKNSIWQFIKGLRLFIRNFPKNPQKSQKLLKGIQYDFSTKNLYRSIPFLHRKTYDIIHCQFGTLGRIGLILRKIGVLEGKLITTFRGIDISRYVQEQGNDVYNELFQEGNYFLANCEFFRQKALKLGCNPQKIIVHGSGIDCRKFHFTPRCFPSDGIVRLAMTGRLVSKKGIEYCIRAVAIASQTYPQLELNIIGDGELKNDLENLISRLKMSSRIHLLGWKQQDEIIQILDKSHIFLAPSVTAEDGNQDAPVNTLKEAMAMGLPVISTYHGGIPELVEDGKSGFLVPERDSEAIAQKLLYLVENPEIWESMGLAGRRQVENKYNMEKLNDELVEIYQGLLISQPESVSQPILFSLAN
jgi:colanic acid/amylovoran biosynthesis glycosyltransferase